MQYSCSILNDHECMENNDKQNDSNLDYLIKYNRILESEDMNLIELKSRIRENQFFDLCLLGSAPKPIAPLVEVD